MGDETETVRSLRIIKSGGIRAIVVLEKKGWRRATLMYKDLG